MRATDTSRPQPARFAVRHMFRWLFVLPVAALILSACEVNSSPGERVLAACLEDEYPSPACRCYVGEVRDNLTWSQLTRYDRMAGEGYYSDRNRIRSVFEEEGDFFERAARTCDLNLWAVSVSQPDQTSVSLPSHETAVPPANPPLTNSPPGGPSFLTGSGPRGRPGYEPLYEFPREPWPYRLGEDDHSPICIRGFGYGEAGCMPREQAARLYNDGARYWLLRGDAELATVDLQRLTDRDYRYDPGSPDYRDRPYFEHDRGSMRRVMRFWNRSVDWGRPFGAQSALMAQRRLQAHMVQCESSPVSLARVARRGPDQIGDVISLELRQAALASLGYYAGDIDGHYGPTTRDAVRGFQRELGYDETGTLTPRQTTLLICHAAQTAREPHLQNALGIMYATGLGVEYNPDLSLEWFETAARRDDPDAYFNLAIVFGTGAVLGSYRLCGIIENPERADAYLRDAARLGHNTAQRWRASREFNAQPNATDRWQLISTRLESAAISRGSLFYLDWRNRIDLDRLESAPLQCLEAQ